MNSIGDRIRELRRSGELTQQQLADMLYVSRQAISNWENSKSEPDLLTLAKISRMLHRDLDCLIDSGAGAETMRGCMALIDTAISEVSLSPCPPAADMPAGEGGYETGVCLDGGFIRISKETLVPFDGGFSQRLSDELEFICDIEEDGEGLTYIRPRLKNGGVRSGRLTFVRSLDMLLPVTELALRLCHGDDSAERAFIPESVALAVGDCRRETPTGGRSSDETAFPFFTLAYGTRALLVAIGWTGKWRFDVSVSDAGTRVSAGIDEADFFLEPGETVMLPTVLLLEGMDDETLYHRFKRFVKGRTGAFQSADEYLPTAIQNFDRYAWGRQCDPRWATLSGQKRSLEVLRRCPGIDTLWLDAAWFPNGFPDGVGNMSLTAGFAEGLKPVSDAAHAENMRFLVWFEPERVCPDTDLAKKYPQFLLNEEGTNYSLFDLSRPEAVDALAGEIISFMRKHGVDCYRQDFNMRPLGFWRQHDAPERSGVTELHYVEGLYRLWDKLREAFPGLLIDNCASGGRRIDLETLLRTVFLWHSDTGCYAESDKRRVTVWQQNQTLTLSRLMPYHATCTWSADPYSFRSAATSGVACNFDILSPDFDFAEAAAALEEHRQLRPYWSGDFYPLTKPTNSESVWCVWRWQKGEGGAVYFFRREKSLCPTMSVRIPDATAEAQYELTLHGADRRTELSTVSGRALRDGVSVRLDKPRSSCVLEYRKKN